VWNTDGSATVSNTPRELVDGLSFVETCETLVVVWTVNSDVLFTVFFECVHELEEVVLTTSFTHECSGEVTVHTGTVPVTFDWLTVVLHVYFVLFTETLEKEACHPDLVSSCLGALAEYLEFPLTGSNFCVDTFVVDTCFETEVEVSVSDFTADRTNVLEANTAVVTTLWFWVTANWETEWATVLHEEVLLLETEPCTFVISDSSTGVGWVCSAVWKHNFTHYENTVYASWIWIESNWLKDTIGVATFSLKCGGTIEAPLRKVFKSWE
jgi:hypothetical protein